ARRGRCAWGRAVRDARARPAPDRGPVRSGPRNTARPPASSAVQVSALFRPELLVEIEAFAVLPEGTRQ
ncbi:hypothetical protein AB0N23_12370, partial [Streptomyces sp. NPDC052644]